MSPAWSQHRVELEEGVFHRGIAASARRAGSRCQFDRSRQAERADVDHVRRVTQGVDRLGPRCFVIPGALEEPFVAVEIERPREPRRRPADAPSRCSRENSSTAFSGAFMKASWIERRTMTPPIGTVPEVTPLAKVIMSGTTP